MNCPNHPSRAVTKRCGNCQRDFCGECVVMTPAGARCPDCPAGADAAPAKSSASTVVIVVVGVLLFTCVIIGIIAAIAIPNLIQARKHGNEARAIGALKTIATSEAVFREGDKDQNGKLDYGTLQQLRDTMLIDTVLGSGTRQGYLFEAHPGTDTEFFWWAKATPAIPGTTGDRVFFTNQTGVIYYVNYQDSAASATPDPKTCDPPQGALPVGR